jgi:hypothetical protein
MIARDELPNLTTGPFGPNDGRQERECHKAQYQGQLVFHKRLSNQGGVDEAHIICLRSLAQAVISLFMKEAIYIRAPEGTRSRIEAMRGRERPADFLRRALEAGLEVLGRDMRQNLSHSSSKPVNAGRGEPT